MLDNELERILALSNLDLDYYDAKHGIEWLAEMAASVAGTQVSLVNLIDSYTQWSIASVGMELTQMPREDSVCQYTLGNEEGEFFEVDDLRLDERFKEKKYVTENPNLTYYLGVPLKTSEGYNLGSLCVMDVELKQVSQEKRELLKMIARQIVDRLKVNSKIQDLEVQIGGLHQSQRKLAHDIRGPLGGIMGLAEIIISQGRGNDPEEVLEYMGLIEKSSKSMMDLADEILEQHNDTSQRRSTVLEDYQLNLKSFRTKILDMFTPQAILKEIDLQVILNEENQYVPFPKAKLMQIVGNLVSNSIKFTPSSGSICILLDLKLESNKMMLEIKVRDSGMGMSQEKIIQLLSNEVVTELGTSGEKGFGFGVNMVRKLVKYLHGEMSIQSEVGKGTEFTIKISFN
ncbi:GAF domain-containing sensor histidine kinase [Algoriphagus lutimaris]|uniref:GAF domain-containing sensor histidine kinase n=1 Tax=Algoriphagus lutimaris TaxID=613197 RepID=UPI00196A691D|nr:GAF domain-containing sensor histidine kinase [Algoriphagus lutimaris]MBN3519693.1 GAF domain-containing sensor histidine kinase [Algoriphagus lutimaris]